MALHVVLKSSLLIIDNRQLALSKDNNNGTKEKIISISNLKILSFFNKNR
jgi:hypothetical protein